MLALHTLVRDVKRIPRGAKRLFPPTVGPEKLLRIAAHLNAQGNLFTRDSAGAIGISNRPAGQSPLQDINVKQRW